MGYKRGQIGRTTCEVLGHTIDGEARTLPAGSLVEVYDRYEVEGEEVRYCVVQRSEAGDLWYDGAWDGFLTDVR